MDIYSIIECKGKQYNVKVGDSINTDLVGLNIGEQLNLVPIISVCNKEIYRSGYKVLLEVIDEIKGKKIHIIKFKNKIGYKKKMGYRHKYSVLKVVDIRKEVIKNGA